MPDLRPQLSALLSRLPEGELWFTWSDGLHLLLRAVASDESFDPPGKRAIIVNRGRFARARVVYKDGLRAHAIEWLQDGPRVAVLHVKPRDVRAIIEIALPHCRA